MPKKNHRKITAAYPFPSDGKGLIFKDQPIGVRFPPAISNYLRSRTDAKGKKDTQDFVRAAVAEKLARDGINIEASIDPETEDQDYADRNFGDTDSSPAERMADYRFSLGERIQDDPLR